MMPTRYASIFMALSAEFHPSQVKSKPGGGGRTLSYVTARTIANRLDEVLGPENWRQEFSETKDGMKCRLWYRLPDGDWNWKEDGGGFAGMAAEDDNEKSAYSDAFKRAAVMLGPGRYLYKDGIAHLEDRHEAPESPPVDTRPATAPKAERKREAPPASLVELYGRMLKRWAEAEGDDTEATATARRKRIVNRIVTDAIKAGHVEESKVNQANGHRDPRKAEGCMEWLWQYQRDWTIRAAAAYLREKIDAATNPDAPIPDEIQQAQES